MDGVCAVQQTLADAPQPPEVGDPAPESARPAVVAYLQATGRTLDTARDQLQQLGPPPPAGVKLVAGYERALSSASDRIADSLAGALLFPPDGMNASFVLAQVEMATLSPDGPTLAGLIKSDSLLAKAHELAARC